MEIGQVAYTAIKWLQYVYYRLDELFRARNDSIVVATLLFYRSVPNFVLLQDAVVTKVN